MGRGETPTTPQPVPRLSPGPWLCPPLLWTRHKPRYCWGEGSRQWVIPWREMLWPKVTRDVPSGLLAPVLPCLTRSRGTRPNPTQQSLSKYEGPALNTSILPSQALDLEATTTLGEAESAAPTLQEGTLKQEQGILPWGPPPWVPAQPQGHGQGRKAVTSASDSNSTAP